MTEQDIIIATYKCGRANGYRIGFFTGGVTVLVAALVTGVALYALNNKEDEGEVAN